MLASGEAARVYLDSAVRHVLLRQGMLGIKVRMQLGLRAMCVRAAPGLGAVPGLLLVVGRGRRFANMAACNAVCAICGALRAKPDVAAHSTAHKRAARWLANSAL